MSLEHPPQKREDAPEHGQLDVARFASLMAHVAHFPPERAEEVRRRLGIREPDWSAALVGWSGELARSAAAGELALATAFATAFAAEKGRLATQAPAVEQLRADPQAERVGEETAAAVDGDEPKGRPEDADEPLREARASEPEELDASHGAGPSALEPATPLARFEPAVAPPPVAATTASHDSASAARTVEPRPPSPWAGRASSAPRFVHVPAAPAVPPPDDLDSTAAARPLPLIAPLPFGDTPSQGFLESLAKGPAPSRAPAPPAGFGPTACGETEEVDVAKLVAAAKSTLPFKAPGDSQDEALLARLTVEQYASFCAELEVYPERIDEVRSRYGVASTEEHGALARAWHDALTEDPVRLGTFRSVAARYAAWLRGGRKG